MGRGQHASFQQICQISLQSRFCVGQACNLKHEPSVKTVARYKDDGNPFAIKSPFCCANYKSLSANPNQLKTERSENNLRLCGENWLTILKFSSLMDMTKVYSSSQRSMLTHNSSASKVEESELENRCSNLLRLEVDSCLPLFYLICVFLVFLLKCCNGFSIKLTGLMCDGRSVAYTLFRRLAARGAFFCGFPFRWVLHFVVFDSLCCFA